MVLEFKVSHDTSWQSLWNLWPVFLSYALSFLFVGLYWSSHHHLFHMAEKINNKILWVNMLGLFFLSFTPFATAWMGENAFNQQTVTLYAIILTLSVVFYKMSYFFLLKKSTAKVLPRWFFAAFKFTDDGVINGGCKLDKNNNLVFYVSDTGIGIPIDKQEAVRKQQRATTL